LKKFFLYFLLAFFISCTYREQTKLYEKAEEKILQEEYSEANSLLKRVVILNTKSKIADKAFYWMGYISEIYLKDYNNAVFNYNEFLTRSTDEVAKYEVMKKIAFIYFEYLNETEKAINVYKKILEINPKTLEEDFFLIKIAESYYRINSFDNTRNYCRSLIDKFPKSEYSVKAHYYLMNTYFLESKCELAIEAAKNLIQFSKSSSYSIEAKFIIGQCYEQIGKFQNAYNIYKELENKYSVPKIIKLRLDEIRKKIKSPN